MKTDRIQAFSDGIFSILITILVLEFHLPDYTPGNMFGSVTQQWPNFFAYVITFTYIGILWLFHHDMFSYIKCIDAKLNVLNLISIFLTTLLNYSMSLLAESLVTLNIIDLKFSITFYAFLALSISMSYFAFYRYLAKKNFLLQSSNFFRQFKKIQKFPLFSSSIYLLALLFTFFNAYIGLFFLISGILFHGFAYWYTVRKTAVKV
jgi:uncharacterized membrane protein